MTSASPFAPRFDVLGVQVSAVDRRGAVATIGEWVRRRDSQYVCVTGVHGVMESRRDPALREIHNRSGLTVADGRPLLWAGRAAGMADMGQVRGCDLMLDVCRAAAEQGWSAYFYGGKEGVPDLLVDRLRERFGRIRVAGTYSPPFRALTAAEDDAVVDEINRTAPDLVWVGLSTPKQERWMARHRPRLTAPVLLGVGAAFDMNAGLVPTAPGSVQRLGLEWLYRLSLEPRRLGRRYLANNPRFVASILTRRPRPVPVTGDIASLGEPAG
jgi:N-acetylglucosaminyldiphosphoundecaprenol N-acetyl-beta-D-mannosaminyltransferase